MASFSLQRYLRIAFFILSAFLRYKPASLPFFRSFAIKESARYSLYRNVLRSAARILPLGYPCTARLLSAPDSIASYQQPRPTALSKCVLSRYSTAFFNFSECGGSQEKSFRKREAKKHPWAKNGFTCFS